ncbi:YebC/PmpR family DNA-binding transcriptional regulator [Solimonas sp. K1W22B-7]|uniref:YebC/PmpR family DNA-binding transcriptional regulator n=1 Tax=Solimonas sp. K1W22B-7 TaxID=2303331 RepID=UPI000E333619|nr:YebC/PmpR family DNA-binding transcriptional regulator [Solimonas sp. K1W22B-7]AXQ29580.1 YebC/PmpR family DNA-binding transcriptional regulator [Solimonas sp. K1W22B-7]
MGRGPSIEARKNATDAARGKLFTKFIREITVAARTGGVDPKANSRLRIAMDKALTANMTKDTIERAIKRGSGEGNADAFEEIRYEGYGPGGVAIMVDCMTDNPTRTVAEVRHAFSKCGGHMGTSGSVAFQFSRSGQILFESGGDAALEEKILEQALEAGADDVINHDEVTEVLVAPESFVAVKAALEAQGLKPVQADITMRPGNTSAVSGEQAAALQKLIDMLEDLDDVQKVYSNAEFA